MANSNMQEAHALTRKRQFCAPLLQGYRAELECIDRYFQSRRRYGVDMRISNSMSHTICMFLCICIQVLIHTHLCVCREMHVCMWVLSICASVRAFVYLSVCRGVFVRLFVCLCTCKYIRMSVYRYIHVQTQSLYMITSST